MQAAVGCQRRSTVCAHGSGILWGTNNRRTRSHGPSRAGVCRSAHGLRERRCACACVKASRCVARMCTHARLVRTRHRRMPPARAQGVFTRPCTPACARVHTHACASTYALTALTPTRIGAHTCARTDAETTAAIEFVSRSCCVVEERGPDVAALPASPSCGVAMTPCPHCAWAAVLLGGIACRGAS